MPFLSYLTANFVILLISFVVIPRCCGRQCLAVIILHCISVWTKAFLGTRQNCPSGTAAATSVINNSINNNNVTIVSIIMSRYIDWAMGWAVRVSNSCRINRFFCSLKRPSGAATNPASAVTGNFPWGKAFGL
jgi:hypothetical protein